MNDTTTTRTAGDIAESIAGEVLGKIRTTKSGDWQVVGG